MKFALLQARWKLGAVRGHIQLSSSVSDDSIPAPLPGVGGVSGIRLFRRASFCSKLSRLLSDDVETRERDEALIAEGGNRAKRPSKRASPAACSIARSRRLTFTDFYGNIFREACAVAPTPTSPEWIARPPHATNFPASAATLGSLSAAFLHRGPRGGGAADLRPRIHRPFIPP